VAARFGGKAKLPAVREELVISFIELEFLGFQSADAGHFGEESSRIPA